VLNGIRIVLIGILSIVVMPSIFDDVYAAPDTTTVCYLHDEPTQISKSSLICASSVLRAQSGNTYGPDNLITEGAWCEGVPGDGIGQALEFSEQPYETDEYPPSFDRLVIQNGYVKSKALFSANSRVKKVEILTDTGQRWIRELADTPHEQEITLGVEISPEWLRFTILEVYPGDKHRDTCISALYIDFGF